MKKTLTSFLLLLTMIFAFPSAVFAAEEMEIESIGVFSDDRAWVCYDDGFGVVDENLDLIYTADEEKILKSLVMQKDEEVFFERAPFDDEIAYYQAPGYGYVIIDDEGDELASAFWTMKSMPAIMARGDDLFLIREYFPEEECFCVYAITAHGKVKGEELMIEDGVPSFRYIGEGLFLGKVTDGNEETAYVFNEDEREFYENEIFSADDFYGFDDDGRGFVFLDEDCGTAYQIGPADMRDRDELEAWAEEPAGFEASEETVTYFEESFDDEIFYSARDKAYIDFSGSAKCKVPDFDGLTPVSFGRMDDGRAPVLLKNTDDVYYAVFLDMKGEMLYEPYELGIVEDGTEPVLADRVSAETESGAACVFYDNGIFAAEVDDNILVIGAGGNGSMLEGGVLTGICEEGVLLKNGVMSLDGKEIRDTAYVTEDTSEADQDWLAYAAVEGVYDGSDGTIIRLYADGTGFYQEPGSTTHADLKAGVETTFEVDDDMLTIYDLAYPIFADVRNFAGKMTMMADDPGWHDEVFTRKTPEKRIPDIFFTE